MKKWILSVASFIPSLALAATVTVKMYDATVEGNGQGGYLGTVVFEDSQKFSGVMITPDLNQLPTGTHGFHIHEHPNCSPSLHEGTPTTALSAGMHLDPENTGKHLGPYQNGHLGDLPILVVDNEGKARHPTLAPRITVADIQGHALMIHAGSDDYFFTPDQNGGGGARIGCGIIGTAN